MGEPGGTRGAPGWTARSSTENWCHRLAAHWPEINLDVAPGPVGRPGHRLAECLHAGQSISSPGDPMLAPDLDRGTCYC